MTTKPTALEMVAAERQRQIETEGYSIERDLLHTDGALALAAACYAAYPVKLYQKIELAKNIHFDQLIPFSKYDINPKHSELRLLIIAGAFILAEIDRITHPSNEPDNSEKI